MNPTTPERITDLLALANGDRVRVTYPASGLTLEGLVAGAERHRRRLEGDPTALGAHRGTGAIIERLEKAPPKRPTQPGLYKDRDGDLVVVYAENKAVRVATGRTGVLEDLYLTSFVESPTLAFAHLPFTLVAPFETETSE